MPTKNNVSENISLNGLFEEFNVNTENELQDKLMGGDWDIVKCCLCQKDISILNCRFLGGDPICPNGCKQ